MFKLGRKIFADKRIKGIQEKTTDTIAFKSLPQARANALISYGIFYYWFLITFIFCFKLTQIDLFPQPNLTHN